MTARDPDDVIRAWFAEGPSRSSGEAVEETLARLAALPRSSGREVRLPLWMPLAAALALLLAAVVAFGAGFRITRPDQLALSSSSAPPATSAGSCRLDVPVHGRNAILVGSGFQPDTGVSIEIERANGTHLSVDGATGNVRTDRTGGFTLGLRPNPEDFGTGHITAVAGCAAAIDVTVTAADLPAPCPDPASDADPIVDGPAYAASVAVDAPLAWWRFDDSGDLAADSTGAHSGTAVGTIVATARSPLSTGTAAFFDQRFPDTTDIEVGPLLLQGDFSIEFWLFFCHWGDGDAIVGSSASRASVQLGEGEFNVTNDLDVVIWAGEAVVAGAWQHYVVTRSGSTMTIYLNGAIDEQYPDTGWTGDFPISLIGSDAGGDNLVGFLDEVALYDHALTPERIAAHAHP